MKIIKIAALSCLLLAGLAHAENFSALAPDGVVVRKVVKSAQGHDISGVTRDNDAIKVFMNRITSSSAGTPYLQTLVLNPDGPGKYFEMKVLREGETLSSPDVDDKHRLRDSRYSVRAIVNRGYFEIDGRKYFSQSEIRNAYQGKRHIRLVICQEQDAPATAVNELVTTFSRLDTRGIDVLAGSDCH